MSKIWIRKIPFSLGGMFKEAVKAGVISIAAQHAEHVLVDVYTDYLQHPLKEFFDNAPHLVEDGYHCAVSLAEEALNEVQNFVNHTVVDPVVHGFEEFEHAVANEAQNWANTVGHVWDDVGGFVSHIF